MTFRRRLFVATLTVGGGICCFQPVMRSRMEARLSELVGGRATIGSSKISLRDSTIALSDITIRPCGSESELFEENTFGTLKIGQAALRFNWSSLLYRNLKVEKILASNVHWDINEPSDRAIPKAVENADPSLFNLNTWGANLEETVDSIVQPIKQKLAEESSKQNRTQQKISLQLKSIADRLAEVSPSDESFNILRQPYVVSSTKRELNDIHQLIAEDKLARKEAIKAITALKSAAQKQLDATVNLTTEADPKSVTQAAMNLAKLAVAKQWNQNRSVVQATIASLTALQTPVSTTGNSLSQLPVGLLSCSTGKIDGNVQLPLQSKEAIDSDFVLQFWNLSSRSFSEETRPAVTLRVSRDPKQEMGNWLRCSAQRVALPQSETSLVQLSLETNDEMLGVTSAKIQHANRGWSATFTVPVQNCLELPTMKAMTNDSTAVAKKACVVGKLMGTTNESESALNNLLIEVDAASLGSLERHLSECFKSDSEKKKAQAGIRSTELFNQELLIVNSRWEQLGDEYSRAHENWEARITELKSQLQELESAFKRTSRASSQITR